MIKKAFTAGIRSVENFKFEGDITSSAKLEKCIRKIQNQYHK